MAKISKRELEQERAADCVLDYMVRNGISLTRKNYLSIAWLGSPPQPLEEKMKHLCQNSCRTGGNDMQTKSMTTEQLGEWLIEQVLKMDPDERAHVRAKLKKAVGLEPKPKTYRM